MKNKPAILLAERDDSVRQRLFAFLLCEGFTVGAATDTLGILRALRQKEGPRLLILNASLDTTDDGLEIVRLLRRWNNPLPVILLAAESCENLAIAALRAGVTDYIKAPFTNADVLAGVKRCLAEAVPPEAPVPSPCDSMVGDSPLLRESKTYLLKVAAADSNLLITGETGTGKELASALIHQYSPRRRHPLVCINCAAIPDSLLESELFGHEKGAFTGAHARKEGQLSLAREGTVFFDEIGDMSPYAQAKILRAIENKEVQRLGGKESVPLDVRIIAATNRDLEHLVATEKFRADLYFRLNVARVHLPPLRERKEDIPALVDHYIGVMNQRFARRVQGMAEEAMAFLLRYEWPGNVRELKNLIEGIFINLPAHHISFADFPEHLRARFRAATAMPQDERARLLATLFSTQWNVSKAAQQLRWSRMTLYRKMAKYRIIRTDDANGRTTTVPGGSSHDHEDVEVAD